MLLIKLLNTPQGEVECKSVEQAEVALASCLSSVNVRLTDDGETLQFVFNPGKVGFRDALLNVRNRMEDKRNNKAASVQPSGNIH